MLRDGTRSERAQTLNNLGGKNQESRARKMRDRLAGARIAHLMLSNTARACTRSTVLWPLVNQP